MRRKSILAWLALLIVLVTRPLFLAEDARASTSLSVLAQSSGVTAGDLIAAMNTLRVSYGLPALIEHPIVDAVAQATADYMAANNLSGHIGNVRGRLASAGYGGGATVWATENWAMGSSMGIDEIMVAWSDYDHMRPALIPAYCHVGAGVAQSANGMTYYVLQAAYTSSGACGEYVSVAGDTPEPGSPAKPGEKPVSQIIIPVKIATPDAEGKIYHVVQPGQSFWAIAITYKITIRDIEIWNNISRANGLQPGQRLFIPSSNTAGYATPTPVGMIIPSTPDADGKIIHTVQPYNTLITIAQAYGVTVDKLLILNAIQVDWPLQIGQKLLVDPGHITPSPTPRPLTPVEKLTPASDGKYYHIVKSGETLSWIANLYKVALADLMVWNGLNNFSIIHPEDKLILQVTPPATSTYTPGPATITPTVTDTPPPPTATLTPSLTPPIPTITASPTPPPGGTPESGAIVAGLAVVGVIVLGWIVRRSYKSKPD